MKLSIITINYNNVNGLRKTIESVVSQTYTDFEWIVIDGGSTDGSKELIEEYSSHFAYWVSEPDKGVYNAMNKGVVEAHGDYLLFLNSGDWIHDFDVLKSVEVYLNSNFDFIFGNVEKRKSGEFVGVITYPDVLSMQFFYVNTICHQTMFIKRSLFNELQYSEDYKIVSDWDFVIRNMLLNKSFKHIPITVCCYDMDGISSINETETIREHDLMISKYFPITYQTDIQLIAQVESNLAHISLDEFICLCSKHNILKKIITVVIRFMKFLS